MRQFALFLSLLVLLSAFFSAVDAQQPTDFDLDRIQRATVYVMQARNVGDNLFVTCVGTGTLVSRSGLILTNAHNTVTSSACNGETLVVAMSVRPDEPPLPQYRAEIAQADEGVDLALLRITRQLDGRLLDASTLALPFVELADASSAQLDETITVVGYPGIKDDPVNAVRGTIIGFVSEPRSNSAWIKTRAEIPGTMSGGGAYDTQGRLVGIPTTAPLSRNAPGAICLPIQDTNRDGLVNESDDCIAVGGFINSLRPTSFAAPLLRAASLGLSITTPDAALGQIRASGQPSFKRPFFAPSVNEAGMPTSVIGKLPAGSNSLYLFFDYDNMSPETIYELRVTTDGNPNPTFSLAPARWSGGSKGMWYIGSSGQPWPNGVYEFTLFINGSASQAAKLTIGGAPDSTAVISDIVFALLDARGQPYGIGNILPTGNTASARFVFRGMVNGTNWTSVWYLNGTEVNRVTSPWDLGSEGFTSTSIEPNGGLPPGNYRLELYIESRLAATSDLIIAGAQRDARPDIFSNLHFTTASSPEEATSTTTISNFTNSVNTLYALFNWQQIALGTLWKVTWLVDDEPFYEQIVPWNNAESGGNFLLQLSNTDRIPDGTYTVRLSVNNVVLASTDAQVGIGQLAIDQFAQASGVQMRGQILDADTRLGVPGVTFILLSKEFSVTDFIWDENQVYALAVTDRNGNFEIDRPLELSSDTQEVAYSAIISADGYLPVSADGIEVDETTANPLNMVIYLTHD